jgi:hypothetical protein
MRQWHSHDTSRDALETKSSAANAPMLSDDFPLRLQILVGVVVPPILTVACWLLGRRVARSSGGGTAGTQGRTGFWTMLIAAYVIFALALAGRHFLAKHERADPSELLVQ